MLDLGLSQSGRGHGEYPMLRSNVEKRPFNSFPLWRDNGTRPLFAIDLEITARCNNECAHCYINLDRHDTVAEQKELTFEQIKRIAEEALSLGTLWVLITGGEPLLRKDFEDIYLFLKRRGFLVSVFTNATLISDKLIRLFQAYPPRDLEVTVYGVSRDVYEAVTRKKGSFRQFQRGLGLLLDHKIKTTLKTTVTRSNRKELPHIMRFCKENSQSVFRFDPYLQLRFDGNDQRNKEIREERLIPEEIERLEKMEPHRLDSIKKACAEKKEALSLGEPGRLFHCGIGLNDCAISHDGWFRLCPSLVHPDLIYRLTEGSLTEAWRTFTPKVISEIGAMHGCDAPCLSCDLKNLCLWCPAHAFLETGSLNGKVPYFCKTATLRETLF